ncbi:hypothetical protein EVAR_67572_1 [Eumeta japonica]|uniref:Uncharacterized protein n=1 Tax=Eumeta variegata TaxID=151549 RepID=A0A4C1ZHV9_EUMVA|nr:hypothetical protein EVAR_67572_1 [Eumeta japonica]
MENVPFMRNPRKRNRTEAAFAQMPSGELAFCFHRPRGSIELSEGEDVEVTIGYRDWSIPGKGRVREGDENEEGDTSPIKLDIIIVRGIEREGKRDRERETARRTRA